MGAIEVTITGNQDMSSFTSGTISGTPGIGDVIVVIDDDPAGKLVRAAALKRAIEKLAEDGWI